MKKHAALSILLVFLCLYSSAQKTRDVLHLKNGSMIYGKLIEADASSYKIQTSDGSLLIYPAAEVEKLSTEAPLFEGRKKSGFSFSLESGLLIGAQSSGYSAPFSFNALAGGVINTKNIVSFGTGVEFIGRPFTPLFVEYKYIVKNKKVSPFIFVRGGAIVPLGGDENSAPVEYYGYGEKDYKGGFSGGFGSGISWSLQDYETYLSFAYRNAYTSYSRYEGTRGNTTYKNTLNRLEIKFGFKF
jgi:hypothetical protein